MKDLFGFEQPAAEVFHKKTYTPARGYVMPPGTGPSGETCGSCKHLYRNRLAKTYLKCYLNRGKWTSGHGSDVLSRSPACIKWQSSVD